MSNPRYPHHCKIYRVAECDSFSDGETITIYDGICRKQSTTNIRSFKTGQSNIGQVTYGDFRVSIPCKLANLKTGDIIDVTDELGVDSGMEVMSPAITNISEGCTRLFYNKVSV